MIKLSHGWEETLDLTCCVPQTFVSLPKLEINEGTVWDSLTSIIS